MKQADQSKNSNFADLVKFIMSIFVVAIHADFMHGNSVANMLISDVFGRIAVPFFFIAAAFFLFRHKGDADFSKRVAKYLTRMSLAYVLCTVVYLPVIIDRYNGKISLLKWLKIVFFEGSYRQLWFLPALIFAVLLVYLLVRAGLSTGKIFYIALPLYIIGCAFHSFYNPIIKLQFISDFATDYYTVFGTTRNGLFFGFVYVALGAYLATHSLKIKLPAAWIGFAVSVVLVITEVMLIEEYAISSKGMGMYISVLFAALFLFWISVNTPLLSRLPSKPFILLRKLSTVIYFTHTMFLYLFSALNYNAEFWVACACSIGTGFIYIGLTALVKRIKARSEVRV